jgi:uncharacterized protein YgbK (DUF1537 family)
VKAVWVGSTGLSEFVPLALGLVRDSSLAIKSTQAATKPVLLLVGSASETTRQQIAEAQTVGLRLTTLDPITIVSGGEVAKVEIERVVDTVRAALASEQDAGVAVQSLSDDIARTQQLGATLGLSAAQVAGRISEALAEIGKTVAGDRVLGGIFATGGDTSKALCDALKAEALEIVAEVEAGIPLMKILGPVSLPLVIKAGGFGSSAAITQSIEMIKNC